MPPRTTPRRKLPSPRVSEHSTITRTHLPTKYSTSYGSPLASLPDRNSLGAGGSLRQAAARMLRTAEEDRERTQVAESPELSDSRESSPINPPPPRPPAPGADSGSEDLEENATQDDEQDVTDDEEPDLPPPPADTLNERKRSHDDSEDTTSRRKKSKTHSPGRPAPGLPAPPAGQPAPPAGQSAPPAGRPSPRKPASSTGRPRPGRPAAGQPAPHAGPPPSGQPAPAAGKPTHYASSATSSDILPGPAPPIPQQPGAGSAAPVATPGVGRPPNVPRPGGGSNWGVGANTFSDEDLIHGNGNVVTPQGGHDKANITGTGGSGGRGGGLLSLGRPGGTGGTGGVLSTGGTGIPSGTLGTGGTLGTVGILGTGGAGISSTGRPSGTLGTVGILGTGGAGTGGTGRPSGSGGNGFLPGPPGLPPRGDDPFRHDTGGSPPGGGRGGGPPLPGGGSGGGGPRLPPPPLREPRNVGPDANQTDLRSQDGEGDGATRPNQGRNPAPGPKPGDDPGAATAGGFWRGLGRKVRSGLWYILYVFVAFAALASMLGLLRLIASIPLRDIASGIVGNIPGLDTRHPAFNETTLGPRLGKMFEGIEERLDRVESSLEKTGHGQQPTEDLVNRVWERIKKEKGIVTDATDARGARVGLSADDINALIDKKLVEKRICGGDTVTKEEFHRLIKETEDRLSKGAVNHEELERAIKKRTGPISQKEVSKSLEDLLKSGKISLPSSGGSDVHPNLAEFQNRVNWFALGNGAYPDQELTSPTYHVPKPILATRKWFSSLRNKPEFLPEKFGALSAWEDAGQCWCAGVHGPSGTQVAADLAVQLHSFVVPEALVIEHINPSATIDPQAVPKDMQVWVRIDEYDRRKAAENYMSVHFEGYLKDPLFAKGLVLVGAFIYEYNAANRGAMIYRFSEELKNMDAATDLVLVRAVTNNGGERTCFYRLRLYGSVDEALVAKLERERESHMWA